MSRSFEWACQSCGTPSVTPYDPSLESVRCSDCGMDWELTPEAEHVVDGRLERCRFCGSGKLYLQKDFNRALGVTLVVLGGVTAILLGIYVHPFLFGAVLMAFIVLDFLLFRVIRLVDVCYRCQTVWRGFDPVPDREGFDLELAEWNERQFTLEVEHRLAGRHSAEGRAAETDGG